MKTLLNRSSRTITSAFAAIVIVGLSGLVLDRGHEGALPAGVVEIGELRATRVGEVTIAALPAVEVIGSRKVQLADVVAADAGAQG